MKNTKKNYQAKHIRPARSYFRILPIAAAMAASGFIQPALAVDRTWFGGTGDFGVDTNWSPAGVPGSGDKAIINGGNSTLSFNSGIAGLDFLGGSLRGDGDLAVSGLTTYSGGQIGGDGGNVIANGGLNISGANNKILGHSNGTGSSGIVNNGAGTWTGTGDIRSWDSGRFTNSAGATLDIQTDADFVNGTFINQGTLTKSIGATDGSDKTVISALFNNSGSVNVTQGVLSLTGGGTHTGSFASDSDGWIEFAGSSSKPTHDLNAGASVTGNARMVSSFGELVVNTGATYNASKTEIIGNGKFSVASGVTANTGTLTMSSGDLHGVGDLAVSGLTTYSGGQIGGDGGNVIANGGLNISGANNKILGHSNGTGSSGIVNNGAGTWTGTGDIRSWDSGRFTNSAGATLDIQTDADFVNGTFINQGTLTKSIGATDGSDKTVISALFNNSGSVNVTQGVLSLTGGGTHTGSFASDSDGWIEFAGSSSKPTHDLNAGASVTGNARMVSSFGELVVNTGATYNASKTEIIGNGKFSVASGVTANTGTLTMSSGDLHGVGDLAVSGLTTYSGGQIGGDGGNVIANGGLNISGANNKILGHSNGTGSSGIVNNGAGTWTGTGDIRSWDSGRFTNSAGATLDIQTDADFVNGTFINQGTLTKSIGATDGSDKTVISALFNNSGSVNVTQGVLSLTGGGTHTGSFASDSDGWIEFAGSSSKPTHDLNAGANVTGNARMVSSFGELVVNTGATYNASKTEIIGNGKFSVASGVTANTGTLTMSSGDLHGVGDLAVSGLTTYSGGQIGGDGGNVIANGGLNISGANNKILGHSNGTGSSGIVNNGAGTWTGTGDIRSWDSGRFTNSAGATLDIQTDADFVNGTFINQGTLTKSIGATDGSDKTVISGAFENSGSVNIQQGTLEATRSFNNQGVINVATGAVFHGSNANFANDGILQGNGTIQTDTNNDLVNTGEINPGDAIGHLTIDGDLNQASGGVINFELASLSSFDQLTITEDVMLGGEIAISNFGYTPVVGDTFVVATFDERLENSTFASVSTPGFGSAVDFDVLYHEHDVTLAVTAVPEPEQYLMFLAGLGLMGAMARRRKTCIGGEETI
ncbi:PEP-CTERM sorting domain-containing protein [Nitrosovibrio sp. Nv4]|uniref:PEP-CTERM sorting domain-containing protein n=1 Tax=Nitrosovibrio sp. Nv4 TaxID=1945880 RepID=UPI000BD865B1|nr:PEP-CTERM sorting domain-containing protein [Nitrosovibrio sp. Nv4]SOD41393.1 PEP-CTERM protein-sorting domain-containing protein [Nitrosovibrio sp. Nv4]